jgi:hypothetical protein
MLNKTINELKLDLTILKQRKCSVIEKLCEPIAASTEIALRKSKAEIEKEIAELELLIKIKQDAAQAVFSKSLNQSKF